jgi:hypothetical protein
MILETPQLLQNSIRYTNASPPIILSTNPPWVNYIYHALNTLAKAS